MQQSWPRIGMKTQWLLGGTMRPLCSSCIKSQRSQARTLLTSPPRSEKRSPKSIQELSPEKFSGLATFLEIETWGCYRRLRIKRKSENITWATKWKSSLTTQMHQAVWIVASRQIMIIATCYRVAVSLQKPPSFNQLEGIQPKLLYI